MLSLIKYIIYKLIVIVQFFSSVFETMSGLVIQQLFEIPEGSCTVRANFVMWSSVTELADWPIREGMTGQKIPAY